MPIQDLTRFDQLCTLCGITLEYYDITGQRHVPDLAVKQALLAAIGPAVDDDADVAAAIEQASSRRWQLGLPPARVYRLTDAPLRLDLVLTPEQIEQPLNWEIVAESGRRHRGQSRFGGEVCIDQIAFGDTRLMRFELELPALDEPGYHRFTLTTAAGDAMQCLLVVAPQRCYQPAGFERGEKAWGLSLQLYTVRSRRNWGIGDFTDLQSIADLIAPLGADLIGLNPLHALSAHLPENASPYSPSSRDFLNPIYLDIVQATPAAAPGPGQA